MSTNLPLFDEPSNFDREQLRANLKRLSEEGVLIGTSSWKYPGWIGQIYSETPYMVRGRFSQKRFERECLKEYAQVFPLVGGDFSFYQFPSDEYWHNLFASAPPHLRFGFKVPEEVTCKRFPGHRRYGARAGEANPTFLSPTLFEAGFLRPLMPHRERVALIMFEFRTLRQADAQEFLDQLDRFLMQLPREWRYAVEIRNEELLQPSYFEVLRRHGVAHIFNSWTRMPPLYKQIELAESFTADYTVVRALLRPGRTYEHAVDYFSPYKEIKEEYPKAREAMRQIIQRSRKRREAAYLFINNRLEGNAPVTIQSIVSDE